MVRGQDSHMGCHESRALAWLAKSVAMYRHRRCLAFDRVHHLNIVADPSTHNKQETMASIVWSWQARVAAHGDLQVLPETKHITPSEQDFPDRSGDVQSSPTCQQGHSNQFCQTTSLHLRRRPLQLRRASTCWCWGLVLLCPKGLHVDGVCLGPLQLRRASTCWRWGLVLLSKRIAR